MTAALSLLFDAKKKKMRARLPWAKRKRKGGFRPIEEVPSYAEVDVETAGDNFVCVVCEDISEAGPYELDEAEDLIPAHPHCRCAFVPAGMGSAHDAIMMIDAKGRTDPTMTRPLRVRMRAEGDRRWQSLARTIRQALIEHDLIGQRGVGRIPHGDKTEGFAAWLRAELDHKVFGLDGSWVRPYMRRASEIAQAHAERYAPGGRVDQSRVASMETLAISELHGIIEAAQQQITRCVTAGMMANWSPTKTANAVSGVIRTMCLRTRAMAEFMIAKTHATSTLSAFRNAGVQRVGTIPEHVRKQPTRDYDPNQARDPHGRWTAGFAGFEFVSPAVGQARQFPEAVAGLHSNRQRVLHEASQDIDKRLGLAANDFDAIGAWSDGAENSMVSAVGHDAAWDALKTSAAMKGHIADQKAVLVFKQQDGGNAVLYNFHVGEDNLQRLHENLLADGVAFHTIAPYSGGAEVYVADLDASAHDAVAKAAERYNAEVTYQTGRAEFIGTHKDTGTDREQRDDARRAYEEIIHQSSVPRSTEVWAGIHNHWGETLGQITDGDVPGHIFHGNQYVEGFEGSSAAMGEASPTKYTNEVDALREQIGAPDFTPAQRQTLDLYAYNSELLNKDARQGIRTAQGDVLDGLIKQHQLPHELVVYRRVGWNNLSKILEGQVGKDFTEPGFMSTTLDPTLKLKPGSFVEIHVPKGASALPVGSLSGFPEEAEVLFPRGSRMHIDSATPLTAPKTMKFVARLYAN